MACLSCGWVARNVSAVDFCPCCGGVDVSLIGNTPDSVARGFSVRIVPVDNSENWFPIFSPTHS